MGDTLKPYPNQSNVGCDMGHMGVGDICTILPSKDGHLDGQASGGKQDLNYTITHLAIGFSVVAMAT